MPLWLHVSVGSDKNLSLASIAFLACFRMAGFLNSGCSQCQTSSFYLVGDIYELDINGLGKCIPA